MVRLAVVLTLLFSPLATHFALSQQPQETGFVISVTLKQGNPEETLAKPRVFTLEGQPARLSVGQKMRVGDEDVRCGLDLDVRAITAPDGKIRVSGMLERSEGASPAEDVVYRESRSVHFAKTVTSGEKLRLALSPAEEIWFELQVERHEPKSEAN